jgi:hypothetical protein
MTQRTNKASVPGISSTPIVIPKEPRFPGPVPGQTERVYLPLAAESRLGFWGALWVCNAVLVGALCVTPVMFIPILPSKGLPALLGMGGFALFLISFGICVLAAAATALLDRMRGSRITIDTAGIWDSRFIRHPIRWTEVSRARIIYRSSYHRDWVFGVQLTLRARSTRAIIPFGSARLDSSNFGAGSRTDCICLSCCYL